MRLRSQTVAVVAALVAVAGIIGLTARQVVAEQDHRLLRDRVGGVGLLLGSSLDQTRSSLEAVLASYGEHPTTATFAATAGSLLDVHARDVVLAAPGPAGYQVVTAIAYGRPPAVGMVLSPARSAVLAQAAARHDFVSGIVTDGGTAPRLLLAFGSQPGAPADVVYQESAIDPYVPDPATTAAALTEIQVAEYAAPTQDPGALILSTAAQAPLRGDLATTRLAVGQGAWLVVIRARQPLVGSFAQRVPWMLFLVSLLTAALAGAVVETLGRRRDYALRLVAERTSELRASLAALQSAQSALQHQAFTDSLTGLPNRALLWERLERAMAGEDDGAVLFVDLDRFKWINDSLGHTAGDQLLVAVAERFRHAVRPGDTVARFGGDEFVVLCDVDDPADASVIASRLTDSLAEPFELDGCEIRLTASVGIASRGRTDPEAALRDADAAMYAAKDRGRDRIQLFDDSMRSRALTRLETASQLNHAIDNGELCVYFQPIIETRTGRLAGAEALVRWNHPTRGLLLPADFVPVAEDSGLVVPMGEFVLEEACRQMAIWNRPRGDRDHLGIGINLSPRQLNAPGVETVRRAVELSGLDPHTLCLEITENALMTDLVGSCQALEAMKDLGAVIAIDDFGTGYASLVYVRQLPVDVLKVDRSFVSGLGHSSADAAIVAGVVNLAQALGMISIAEGVEESDQLDELARLGCHLAQGWWWAPAMPAAQFEQWVQSYDPGPSPFGVAGIADLWESRARGDVEELGRRSR